MAKIYLDQLSELINKINSEALEDIDIDIECKHFFGGAAAYAEGKIFMSLTKVGLALKFPANIRNDLIGNHGAKELQYFAKSPIKKEYALLPDENMKNMKKLRYWFKLSVEYVVNS